MDDIQKGEGVIYESVNGKSYDVTINEGPLKVTSKYSHSPTLRLVSFCRKTFGK